MRGIKYENINETRLHQDIMYRSKDQLLEYLLNERPSVVVLGLDAHILKDYSSIYHEDKVKEILRIIRRTLPGVKNIIN